MSTVTELVEQYAEELTLPWSRSLSGAERVWMLVYPPGDERRIRARLGQLRDHTRAAHFGWRTVDVTDVPGRWLAQHPYAGALFADPTDLTASLAEDLEIEVASTITASLDDPAVDDDTVVALIGVASLYPFVRVSRVVAAAEDHIRGRLLVLFPGHVDRATGNYRLLDARDGFNYRAHLIAEKDSP